MDVREEEELFLNRRPSGFSVLSTNGKKLDIRAHQRTYQGAYLRTTIGTLTFSILLLKLFSREFMKVGILYTVYGMLIFIVSIARLQSIDVYYAKETKMYARPNNTTIEEDDEDAENDAVYYKTNGNFILLISLISFTCYALLFYFIYKL